MALPQKEQVLPAGGTAVVTVISRFQANVGHVAIVAVLLIWTMRDLLGRLAQDLSLVHVRCG